MDDTERVIIESLLRHHNEVLENLQKASAKEKKKGFWDIFSTLSTFLAGVVIAGAGVWFTHIYNQRSLEQTALLKETEHNILQMQTLEKFIPHLVRKNDKENEIEIALIAITTLGNEDFAAQLSELLKKSEGARGVGDKIMASAPSVEQVEVPQAVTASAIDPTKTKSGWAYLGGYSGGEWNTRYFEELSSAPTSYEGSTLTVRKETGSLNIREGPPTPFGRIRKVIDVLRPGSKVVVKSVQQWGSSTYMWAEVRYTPK